MGRKISTDEFINKAKQIHGNKYDYSKCVYVNSRTKIEIICKEHGSFLQKAGSHIEGCGCPKCAALNKWAGDNGIKRRENNQRRYTTEQFIEKAKIVHGDKYDYSRCVYVNSKTKVEIICPIHGVFTQQPDSHLMGHICNKCARKQMWVGEKGDILRKNIYTKERQNKMELTCQKRYGAKTYALSEEGKKHIHDIKSTDEFRQRMSHIISSDIVQQKTKQTNLERYGETSPMRIESVKDKSYETKRKNHTFSTSKPEEKSYKILVDKFGKDDVFRQYKDERYPFRCDFYIKSQDLFIELNASWTHGYHWFDVKSQNDIEKLKSWIENGNKGKRFYFSAIDTWTRRDLKKKETAEKNNLNYLVFWNQDLSDFMSWLNQF